MSLRLVVFYGSVRSNRQGIRAARWVVERARSRGHEVDLLDAAELQLPLLDKMYKEHGPGEAPDNLERMAKAIRGADAFIIVSGEYNHSPPPALTNMLDHFLEEYFWRPSAIVSYSAGSFGGVRAMIALRSMLAELGMSSIPSVLPVPRVQKTLGEDGTPADESMNQRADKFFGELEWYAHALREARGERSERCPSRSECETAQLGPGGTGGAG